MTIFFWYLLIITLLLQGYYLFSVFVPLSRPVRKPNRLPLSVSVIICAKNEAKNIESNLNFVLNQHHAQFEVIVMDDHSDDNTEQVVNELAQSFDNLIYVKASDEIKEKAGKKWALSEAINIMWFMNGLSLYELNREWVSNLKLLTSNRKFLDFFQKVFSKSS